MGKPFNLAKRAADSDISRLLRTLITMREDREWTQQKLALRMNLDRASINRWENGQVMLSAQQLLRWCQALDSSLEEVAGRARL